jgi:ABC-type Fe3+-hydroxamate transport system substrate-binding protein
MDGSVAAAPKTSAKQTEEKRAKFVGLAESRTVNAIRAIRVIGKLGNKSAYEYDDADVKKIISALSKEIDALKARLGQKSGKGEVEFKL